MIVRVIDLLCLGMQLLPSFPFILISDHNFENADYVTFKLQFRAVFTTTFAAGDHFAPPLATHCMASSELGTGTRRMLFCHPHAGGE